MITTLRERLTALVAEMREEVGAAYNVGAHRVSQACADHADRLDAILTEIEPAPTVGMLPRDVEIVVDMIDALLGYTVYPDATGLMPAAMSHIKASDYAAYVKRELKAMRTALTPPLSVTAPIAVTQETMDMLRTWLVMRDIKGEQWPINARAKAFLDRCVVVDGGAQG